jgi:hypothetical protein
MTRSILTATVFLQILLWSASRSTAAIDRIDLYVDPAYSVHEVFDSAPGLLKVYVVHEHTSGATGSAFRIVSSPGFTGTWVSETSPFTNIGGTTPTGVEMSCSGCIAPSALLFEVTYAVFGTSSTCSFLEVVKHPNYPFIYIPDCFADEPSPATGGTLVVNPDATCSTVSIRPTTWGRSKLCIGRRREAATCVIIACARTPS